MRASGKRLQEGLEDILEELNRLLKNGGRIFSLIGVIIEVMELLMRGLKGIVLGKDMGMREGSGSSREGRNSKE